MPDIVLPGLRLQLQQDIDDDVAAYRSDRLVASFAGPPSGAADATLPDWVLGKPSGGQTARTSAAPDDDGLTSQKGEDEAHTINTAIEEGTADSLLGLLFLDYVEAQTSQISPGIDRIFPPPQCSITPIGGTFDRPPPQNKGCKEHEAVLDNEASCPAPPLNCQCGGVFLESTWFDDDFGCSPECTWDMVPPSTPDPLAVKVGGTDFQIADEDEPTAQDLDYLQAVRNFMVANADIAEWLACLLEGPSKGACMRSRLDGTAPPTYDFEGAEILGPKDAGGVTSTTKAITNIVLKKGNFKDHAETYATAGQKRSGEVLCMLARDAAWLIHETLHTCLSFTNEQMDDQFHAPDVSLCNCNCDSTDMIESGFAWAVAQRYPCLQGQKGCDDWHQSDAFLTPCEDFPPKTYCGNY